MNEQKGKSKPQKYVVHDPAARERYRCNTAKAAFERQKMLRDNGRTVYVSPPLPEGFHVPV